MAGILEGLLGALMGIGSAMQYSRGRSRPSGGLLSNLYDQMEAQNRYRNEQALVDRRTGSEAFLTQLEHALREGIPAKNVLGEEIRTTFGPRGVPVEDIGATLDAMFQKKGIGGVVDSLANLGINVPESILQATDWTERNRAIAQSAPVFQQANLTEAALKNLAMPGSINALSGVSGEARANIGQTLSQDPASILAMLGGGAENVRNMEHAQSMQYLLTNYNLADSNAAREHARSLERIRLSQAGGKDNADALVDLHTKTAIESALSNVESLFETHGFGNDPFYSETSLFDEADHQKMLELVWESIRRGMMKASPEYVDLTHVTVEVATDIGLNNKDIQTLIENAKLNSKRFRMPVDTIETEKSIKQKLYEKAVELGQIPPIEGDVINHPLINAMYNEKFYTRERVYPQYSSEEQAAHGAYDKEGTNFSGYMLPQNTSILKRYQEQLDRGEPRNAPPAGGGQSLIQSIFGGTR
jgi:hypothetical protein